jgi:hypothetical protein
VDGAIPGVRKGLAATGIGAKVIDLCAPGANILTFIYPDLPMAKSLTVATFRTHDVPYVVPIGLP